MMVSEREEELKAKIAKLRGATAKGDTYERVVGAGAELTEKMKESKEEFGGEREKAAQVCVAREAWLSGMSGTKHVAECSRMHYSVLQMVL